MENVNKTMKILLGIAGVLFAVFALGVGFLYYSFAPFLGGAPPDRVPKDYIEEKYGFEIDIVETNTFGMGGSPEFVVSPEENEDIRFKIIVDSFDHTIIEDDYPFALEADEEYQKLKSVIPAIEALGFTGEVHPDIRLTYNQDSISLILLDNKEVNFKTFAAEELDRYYELYGLIQDSQADIGKVIVAGANIETAIMLYSELPATVKNKEEFLFDLRRNHPELISHEVVSRLANEVNSVRNDRFYFGSRFAETHGDSSDPWFYCTEVDETANCTAAIITVTYQENGFTSDNLYFEEDLTAIFDFIATHLEPEVKVEKINLEANDASGDWLEIGYEERMSYETVDELIANLLNKD